MTFETVFDERWRAVATYRSGDSDPKELFLHHAAGASGFGGSSYIDHVVLRDRDATNGWAGAADGTLEERVYYCQNWRADVVALIDDEGAMLEWVKYSAYGVPFGLPVGDVNSDGVCNPTDESEVVSLSGIGYDVRGDLDLDGDVNATDEALVSIASQTLGRGALTSVAVRNLVGPTGCLAMGASARPLWFRGNRLMNSELGKQGARAISQDDMSLDNNFAAEPIPRVPHSGSAVGAIIFPGLPVPCPGTSMFPSPFKCSASTNWGTCAGFAATDAAIANRYKAAIQKMGYCLNDPATCPPGCIKSVNPTPVVPHSGPPTPFSLCQYKDKLIYMGCEVITLKAQEVRVSCACPNPPQV